MAGPPSLNRGHLVMPLCVLNKVETYSKPELAAVAIDFDFVVQQIHFEYFV